MRPIACPIASAGAAAASPATIGMPRQHREDQHAVQTRADAAEKPSEPAESAAAQEQRQKRSVVSKLDGPDDLGADQPAENTGQRRVDAGCRQTAESQFSRENPKSRQRRRRHKRAECRDFEIADPEQYGVHLSSLNDDRSVEHVHPTGERNFTRLLEGKIDLNGLI